MFLSLLPPTPAAQPGSRGKSAAGAASRPVTLWGGTARGRQHLPRSVGGGGEDSRLGKLDEQIAMLQGLKRDGEKLRAKLLEEAQGLVDRGEDDRARTALERKAEANKLVTDIETKIARVAREKASLTDPALASVVAALREDDEQNRTLPTLDWITEDAPVVRVKDNLASYLPEIAGRISKLEVVRRIGGTAGLVRLLPSLIAEARRQQKARNRWETDAAAAVWDDMGGAGRDALGPQRRDEALWAAGFLEASYEGTLSWRRDAMGEEGMQGMRVVGERRRAEEGRPAYVAMWDEGARRLIVGIRGLDEIADLFTAVDAQPAPLLDGACHRGALRGADWLLERLAPHIEELAPASVHLMGHSLGGAIATAAMVRLASADTSLPIRVTAFGPPPCVAGERLLALTKGHVTTYVHRGDIVARLSETNVEMLVRSAVGQTALRPATPTTLLLPGRIFHMEQVGGLWVSKQVEAEAFVGPTLLAEEDGILHHRLFSYVKALEESAALL